MTEEQLNQLNPEPNSSEFIAQYVVEAFESRFPELLTNDARYLLFHFIADSTQDLQGENARLREALEYIAHANWEDHPEISNAIDGGYLDDVYSERALAALEGK